MDDAFKELKIKDGPCTVYEMSVILELKHLHENAQTDEALIRLIELCEDRVIGFDSKTYPWKDFMDLGARVLKTLSDDGDIPDVFKQT